MDIAGGRGLLSFELALEHGVPVTLVDPLITPVAELIDSPGGRPVAVKEPLPE